MTPPEQVLEFWFGGDSRRGKARAKWYSKDEKFDAELRSQFAGLHGRASRRELEAWRASPETMLALVLLLDQFSRKLYRGDDLGLLPVERQFLYMPFEHSEAIEDQDLAVEKMRSLEAFEQTRGLTRWAERHRDVIRRFGRFPHRNAIVGRASTPAEIEFLKQPGSSF